MPEPEHLRINTTDDESNVTRYERQLHVAPALHGQGASIACSIWRIGGETVQVISALANNLALPGPHLEDSGTEA
jgi:hypothetical protein